MTNKQIKKYCNGLCTVCDELGTYNEEPCIYKIANELEEKLLCKEQECNKLYIQLKADEEYHKEEENTLRKIIRNKEERNIELYKENNKLKQALTEIKEIAEWKNEYWSLGIDDYKNMADEILQKISECEVVK